ncbi:hypothetical protein IV102_24765 [bacterium]|nr:hypothetical protein [bacterium]
MSQDGTVIIGDQAHIHSFSAKGPQRKTLRKIDKTGDNSYRNLILLCPNHHREVDKQPGLFPGHYLQSVKATHELWVSRLLSSQSEINIAEKKLVDKWAILAFTKFWENWISGLLFNWRPRVDVGLYDDLMTDLPEWIDTRKWDGIDFRVKNSLENFQRVLNTLTSFTEDLADGASGSYIFAPYKPQPLEREPSVREFARAKRFLGEYAQKVFTINNLALELTRACNLIIDAATALGADEGLRCQV